MEKTSEEVGEMKDRLSALPDIIVHKIMSFLSLKEAVQTCVLAKRWENLWKSLPDLLFFGKSPDFTDYSKFSTFISKVLSTRKDCKVGKLRIFSEWPLDGSQLSTLIEYAASHNVKHFQFHHPIFFFDSLWLSPKLLQCKSVEYLELGGVPFGALPDNFSFSFTMLTNLHLSFCSFCYESKYLAVADPFACCPNLKHLSILNCDFPCLVNPACLFSNLLTEPSESLPVVKVLKISGPQLISLQIVGLEFRDKSTPIDYLRIQIEAPKLEYLGYINQHPVYLYGRNLSSLNYANVHVYLPRGIKQHGTFAEKEKVASDLIKMFSGLHNAQFVQLASPTVEALNIAPGLLEKQSPPFPRLKSLKVICPDDSFVIPAHINTYLLGGSTDAGRIQLEYFAEAPDYGCFEAA